MHGGAPAREGVTSNHSMRLPKDLPKFRRNGDNPDISIETLGNSLLAHDVDPSRWTSALLLACSEKVDAAWVRENLLNVPWEGATERFLCRFRDPLHIHRLQSEFYTLRKKPQEKMLSYTAKFERLAYSLGLRESPSLIPQITASLPVPLSSQPQLFSLSSPDVSFSRMLQTAISMDSASSSLVLPMPSPQAQLYCKRHGWGKHTTDKCQGLMRSTSSPAKFPARHDNDGIHSKGASSKTDLPSLPSQSASKSSAASVSGSCHRCGLKGHWAPDCPSKSRKTKAEVFNIFFDQSMLEQSTLDHCTRRSSSPRTASITKDDIHTSKTIVHAGGSLLDFIVEANIDGSVVSALLDSGASHSFIDPKFVEESGWPTSEVDGTVSLAFKGLSAPISGQTPSVMCTIGSRSVMHRFLVMPLGSGTSALFGTSLLAEFTSSYHFLPRSTISMSLAAVIQVLPYLMRRLTPTILLL